MAYKLTKILQTIARINKKVIKTNEPYHIFKLQNLGGLFKKWLCMRGNLIGWWISTIFLVQVFLLYKSTSPRRKNGKNKNTGRNPLFTKEKGEG